MEEDITMCVLKVTKKINNGISPSASADLGLLTSGLCQGEIALWFRVILTISSQMNAIHQLLHRDMQNMGIICRKHIYWNDLKVCQ